jgi:hypothetical protein
MAADSPAAPREVPAAKPPVSLHRPTLGTAPFLQRSELMLVRRYPTPAERTRHMSPRTRFAVLALCVLTLALLPAMSGAQGRGGGQGQGQAVPRTTPRPTVVVRGHVFIGGYFYDPVYGPYPWWPPAAYPYRYFPVYDYRAEIRILATPKEAAVYVDGFYAGVVDDFDGFFQRLPLPPGGHEVVLYLQGYRTVQHHVYLGAGSTLKLHETMARLPEGAASESPPVAPPVPPPPAGSYRQPRVPPRLPIPSGPRPWMPVERTGTLSLRVQPTGAEVRIDGQRWLSSNGQFYVIEIAPGPHLVEVFLAGYQKFAVEVEIREDDTTPLNVTLAKGGRD